MTEIKVSLKRLEDFGRLREKFHRFFDDYRDLFNMCNSKHTIDDFVLHYHDSRNLEVLHSDIRNMKEALYDIAVIIDGEE